jgi:multiple sugar transport system substrate-binding protein
MRARTFAIATMAVLVVGACSGGGGGAGGGAASGGGGVAVDPNNVTGDLVLQGFSAGNVEDDLLKKVLDGFMQKYPKIKVRFETVAGEYPQVMLAKLSARQPPDLFYVQQGYAQDWIKQGVLQELDSFASRNSFDTSKFFPGYLNVFKSKDGKTYGYPKDSSLLALAYNTDKFAKAGVTAPPKTLDELKSVAEKLKAAGETPLCLVPGWDRAGALVEASGGGMLTDDGKAAAIDSAESKAGITYVLDLFKNGLAKRPEDLSADWCGKAFGQGNAAMAIEGNWMIAAMKADYPTIKYDWVPIPEGKEKATLSFTAAYAMGIDSKNKDASWILLSYLTGAEGMGKWAEGGLILPSRSDVAQPADKKVFADQAPNAHAGEGLVPGWSKVQDAFKNALTKAVQAGGTADEVASATKTAIDAALK